MTFAGDDAELAREARELLGKIAAEPRFAGSSAEGRARAFCAELLEQNGFSVTESQVEFSEFTGKYAVPLVALMLAAFSLSAVRVYGHYGMGLRPMAFYTLAIAVIDQTGRWLAVKGTTAIPWMRSRSANLVAVRGEPSAWLVAHIDSKSQTIPMIARIVAFVAAAALVILFSALLLDASVRNPHAITTAAIVAAILTVVLLPLILCFTGNRSPGAADNASGLVSILLAVRSLGSRENIGVVITTGEELGLVGARAFVRTQAARGIAINCDTIDDHGRFRCMIKGRRGAAVAAIVRAAESLHYLVPVTRTLPGILTDGIAFADAGWDCVTLSRGNIATLARVHTSRDTRDRLDGTGIAKASRLIAATIEELG